MKVYELIGYIEVELQKGVERELITKNLLQKGWKQNDIEKAFNLIEQPQVSHTQHPIPNTQSPTSNADSIPSWHVRPQPQIDILKQKAPPKSLRKKMVFLLVFLTGILLIGLIVVIQLNINNSATKLKNNTLQILMRIDNKNADKYASLLDKPEFSLMSNVLNIDKTHSISNPNATILQQVNNVGYSFYLGQIDYPSARPIDDSTKNKITQIIYNAKIPKSLLSKVAIIIVNTLAITKDNSLIQTPDGTTYPIPAFSPDFISGGGIYSQGYGQMSFIFINTTKVFCSGCYSDTLTDILSHELAHYIGSQLTDAEWAKFYQLRNIPSNTPRLGGTWELCPFEDFAEVYKNTFTGLPVKTVYGLIIKTHDWEFEYQCKKIHDDLAQNYEKIHPSTSMDDSQEESAISLDAQLQNCRRDVMLHLEKYPKDNIRGGLYTSIVDQPTKDFINSVVNRLN